ncbi:MAG: hypothetical protein KKH61_21375 [Gammaproteobacteria bacterium]|uniref:Uncharacterized protein n=1 Tax=viral metagenome TaxID=1070528 RepID=A0A6H1ZBU7_9ZZZZ|nr:hypothetical protein [Gammaproteobacteria bacterium]
MTDIMVAAPAKHRVRPAFTVQKLSGQIDRTIHSFDQKGKKTSTTVKVDAGYMVTLGRGHSIRVLTDEDMHRLGFDQNIPLIDFERDGEVVGALPNPIAA